MGVTLGEQLDSQKVTLDRIEEKTNIVTDHTLAVTLRTSQLLRKTHKPIQSFVGTFQFIDSVSNRFLSVSAADGTSITFTTVPDLSSYFHVFVKQDHLFGLLNEKTQRYLGCTVWGTVSVSGEYFGGQEECHVDLGPFAPTAPVVPSSKNKAVNVREESPVTTGLLFTARHWGAGGWLKLPSSISTNKDRDFLSEWVTAETSSSITDRVDIVELRVVRCRVDQQQQQTNKDERPLNVVSPDALEAVITKKSLSSSSTTATKIRLHSELLFAQNDFDEKTSSIPALVRSILLCGAEGAGKSYLLHGLANDLRCGATNKNLSNPCVTVHASAMNVNKAAVEKALKSVHNFRVNKESQVPATVQFAHVYLSVLLELLEVESSVRHNATSALQQGQCLFLVVDDLDLIMAQYGAVGDSAAVGGGDESSAYEGPAVVSPGNEMQIVGYILSKLLKLVAPSHTSNERSSRVMVVGACRLDVKAVPRAHTGCPEFELLVLLPRMSAQDRAIAVLDMISEHLRLQPTNLERLSDVSVINVETIVGQSDGETNVARWACRIAVITAGYLPGDLVALIRHTFLIHRGRMEAEALSVSQGSGILLWDTLLQALLSLPPKQLQSLGIDSSSGGGGPQQQTRLCWADFAGYAHEVRQIKRLFANPRREGSEKHGGAPSLLGLFSCPKGIVLHGPTGCGKSMLARVIAAEANMNFVAIRSTEILSQYFGETEASVRGLFARARAASPCVLFFDEFDAIAHKRGGGDDSSAGLHGRILSTFLNELDGVAGGGGGGFESSVLVLVASNDLSTLDEALLRPGRLQHHVLLGKPSLEDVRAIVARQMLRMPCANEGDGEAIDLSSLCSRLMFVSPSCADAEALCHKALAAAIREQILASQAVTGGALSARRVVCQRHFETALQELVGWRESLPSESDVKLESTPPFVFENRGEFHF
eukprot:gene23780-30048_t